MATVEAPAGEHRWRDRELEARTYFEAALRQRLAALVDRALIDEHRRSPTGSHSPALAHVLGYLRQVPVAGKLALHAVEPRRRWVIVRLSGGQGVAHERADEREFDDHTEAQHAVFLARLAELGLLPGDEHA